MRSQAFSAAGPAAAAASARGGKRAWRSSPPPANALVRSRLRLVSSMLISAPRGGAGWTAGRAALRPLDESPDEILMRKRRGPAARTRIPRPADEVIRRHVLHQLRKVA